MSLILTILVVLLLFVCAVVGGLLYFGAPKTAVPDGTETTSRNESTTDIPEVSTFKARDGSSIAYRLYTPDITSDSDSLVVLLHGSSATSVSFNDLAKHLRLQGFTVVSLDIRGHGESGELGQIDYIGQLEHDISDLVSNYTSFDRKHLIGFSSGGGLALRYGGSADASIFDSYVLISPFISHEAPTHRDTEGTTTVGMLRIGALLLLNKVGITYFNHLDVVRFVPEMTDLYVPTENYSFALIFNFRPDWDYKANIQSVTKPMRVLIGQNDQVFHSDLYESVFAESGKPGIVEIVPEFDHEDMLFQKVSHKRIAQYLKSQ